MENMNGLARCTRYSIAHAGPATKAPLTPSALPAVFTVTSTSRPTSSASTNPLPRAAVDPDGMRLVDDQRAPVRSAERGIVGQRRGVAVHAEQRFDDDERVAAARLGEDSSQGVEVVMRKDGAAGGDSRMPSIRLA